MSNQYNNQQTGNTFDPERAYVSGEPNTTGREPFEDSTASGPGAQFAGSTGNNAGLTGSHGTGEHSHHQGHHDRQHHAGAGAGGLTGAAEAVAGHHGHGHSGQYSGVGEHNSGQMGGIANVGNTGSGIGSGLNENQTRRDEGVVGQSGNTRVEDASNRGKEFTGLSAVGGGEHGHHSHHGQGAGLSDRDTGRVGNLNQDAHHYESTGAGGPATSGAAGTDRFDTDRTRSENTGSAGLGTATGFGGKIEDDVERRGEGKGTGGALGALGTTDKDFTARDRLGKGAYHDDNAAFQSNTSGPGGNTALTGREGRQENNPVAQAKSRAGHDVDDVHGSGAQRVGQADHPEQHKGIMDKIKDALH